MDNTTAERLERLERRCAQLVRQNRRSKLLGGAALLGLVVMVVAGADPKDKPAKVVEAERFVLRDPGGKQRAVLEVNSRNFTSLTLSDAEAKPRMTFIVTADGSPVVNLADEQGKPRISFASSRVFGGSILNIADKEGKIRVGLAVRDDGGLPTLDLRDKDAKRRLNLGVMPDGSAAIHFQGADESQRIRIGLSVDSPSVLMFDKKEQPRLGLVVSPAGVIGLDVFGTEKRLSVGLDPEGKMGLKIVSKDNEVLFEVPKP